mgnify:CR=1 FL=1
MAITPDTPRARRSDRAAIAKGLNGLLGGTAGNSLGVRLHVQGIEQGQHLAHGAQQRHPHRVRQRVDRRIIHLDHRDALVPFDPNQ